MTEEKLPRGIRNNNPGNIRLSSARWQGQKNFQFDPEFAEFDCPVMGVRALMKLLLTYHFRHGLNTVESIINRYAPPSENATDGYIHQVAKVLGIARRDTLDLKDVPTLIKLTQAIVLHENGHPPKGQQNWYPPEIFEKAATLIMKG